MGSFKANIIASDEFQNVVKMKEIYKESDIFVVVHHKQKDKDLIGKLVQIGFSRYNVDVCRINDEFFNSMKEYVPIGTRFNPKYVDDILHLSNNIEVEEYIVKSENIDILRHYNNLFLIAQIENGYESLTLYTVLIDMKERQYSLNCDFIFNNFGKNPSLKWVDERLCIFLDTEYLAEVRLLRGDEYNSPFAIEFSNGLRGLSSQIKDLKK